MPIKRDRGLIEEAVRLHKIVAIQAATGSGKTMKLPVFMFDMLNPGPGLSKKSWPILVVQQAVFVVEKMVHYLVEVFHWPRSQIQLRTGKHDEKFVQGQTTLSVITYGL